MNDDYEILAGSPEPYENKNFYDESERHHDIRQDDPWRGIHPFVSLIGKGAILKPVPERESEMDKRIRLDY